MAERAPVLNPFLVVVEGPLLSHSTLLYAVGPIGYRTEDRDEGLGVIGGWGGVGFEGEGGFGFGGKGQWV